MIQAGSGGALTATFNFYAVPANPGVPSGSYTMTGTSSHAGMHLSPATGSSSPPDTRWSISARRRPATAGTLLSGTVTTSGCTTFSVTKSAS